MPTPEQSKTPVTDAAAQFCYGHIDKKWVPVETAKELEIQRDEAREIDKGQQKVLLVMNRQLNELKAVAEKLAEYVTHGACCVVNATLLPGQTISESRCDCGLKEAFAEYKKPTKLAARP